MARRSRNKNSTKKNKEGDSDLESSVSSELDEEELKPAVDVQTESDARQRALLMTWLVRAMKVMKVRQIQMLCWIPKRRQLFL